MKDTKLAPDDPKLTAYALGELSGDDRAAVEAALRDQPALRATVEEIRAAAAQLEAAFASEPLETFATPFPGPRVNGHTPGPAAQRAEPAAPAPRPRGYQGVYAHGRRRAKLIRFPQFYYIVGGLAAACFAVMVMLYRDAHEAKQQARVAMQKQRDAETRAGLAQQHRVEIPLVALAVQPTAPSLVAETTAPVARVETEDQPAALRPETETVAVTPPPPRTNFVGGSLTLSESPPTERPASSPVATDVAVAMTPPSAAGTASTMPTVPAAPATSTEPIHLDAFTVSSEPESRALAAKSGLEPPRSALTPQFDHNTEAYAYTQDNDFLPVATNRFSTFSVDVDTASYANVRRIIEYGTLPPRDAVRVEELLNYFPYHYPAPPAKGDGTPFAASLEVADAPWAPQHRLVRIGLRARDVATSDRAAANLVFLIDVSGSMSAANKLPLVKESMRLLLGRLRHDDRVAIVTYAGTSGLALQSTPVAHSAEIQRALDALEAGGSTNGGMGIQLAYEIAKANFTKDGINRVILCTDGDFNVGTTSEGELVRLIEEKARTGVFLTVLGFGMGNYKDSTLEKLADKGNGNYGYIDTRREAEKLLVEQVSSTLVTVAKDVKIQVEFNPAKVARYRLIGYENRTLKKEDFNNDNVDAGEIGAGHTVTALYEIVPVGAEDKFAAAAPPVDEPKYQARGAVSSRLEMPMTPPKQPPPSEELLTVKVRYKKPEAFLSEKVQYALKDDGRRFDKASPDFRFAAAVAQFGMILRGSPYKGSATIGDVIAWAATAAASPADDPGGYRGEFIDLARKAARMVQ